MNIYNRAQIHLWDRFTIAHEPITSIDLMERAAHNLCMHINAMFPGRETNFWCICGTGNNGGDGLALSRLLLGLGYNVKVFLSGQGVLSTDCQTNLDRLQGKGIRVNTILTVEDLPEPASSVLIIDALYGTGLTRPVEGLHKDIIIRINSLPNQVISIDMPSGLPADGLVADDVVVRADYTLTIQAPKFSFFLSEHEALTGRWAVIDIGLHPGFLQLERTPYQWVDAADIPYWLPGSRNLFAHKGNFGHAVLLGGSMGMLGALIMAAQSCLRSGVGLCTAGVQDAGIPVLQAVVTEAMCAPQSQWMLHEFYTGKTAVGCGMGWVADDYHGKLLQWILSNVTCPVLIDATGLRLLSQNPRWIEERPSGAATIITPHIGEFNHLTGESLNSEERLEKAKDYASAYNVFVVLKGAYTRVITPGGQVYFNSTGNPGMAKGGSGDVLAGLITGLLAQGNIPAIACLLGVYLHGLAGDLAADALTQQAMTPGEIIRYLPQGWKKLFLLRNTDKP